MQLTLVFPKDWEAVSNGIEQKFEYSETNQNGLHIIEKNNLEWFLDFFKKDEVVNICDFEQTPKISPYLFAVCAGPYKVFEDFDPMHTP